MLLLIIFIFGLITGSFLNVCIYRIPRNESISFPPSHCTNCGERIRWYDLLPVLSYLFLKGRCRYCGEKISIRYPMIELITGALFSALYINYGFTFEFVKFAVLICFLIVIGMIDFDTTDVYLKTTLPGIIAGILFMLYSYHLHGVISSYLLGGIVAFGVIALIIILTKGMGWGDAEICLMCGFYLGFRYSILMLFLSFIFGGFTGILLILLKKKSRKDYMPFGPYIALGAIAAVFLGERLLNWYISWH